MEPHFHCKRCNELVAFYDYDKQDYTILFKLGLCEDCAREVEG